MNGPISRRDALKIAGTTCLASLPGAAVAGPLLGGRGGPPGWVTGRMTGAEAMTEALIVEGTECVFGIPGAQENEVWDTFKSKHLPYLLVTHEYSAACMADGYARSTGKPGVICVVPGPGLTNALTGIGEALLDSVPMVCIVGDIACGENAHAFQVHALPQVGILQHVTKHVFHVQNAGQIPGTIRHAYHLACAGEPGPVGVVIPYNLFIDICNYNSGPIAPLGIPWNDGEFQRAVNLLANCNLRVGIYAGMGCMNYSDDLVHVAELLQAPVATSISGKGVIPENHPLAVGWGYGPQGTRTAEQTFRGVDLVLAMGVKYAEVSTGFYSDPEKQHLIHVDANPDNLGRVMHTSVCVNTDAGLFMHQLLENAQCVRRACNQHLATQISRRKSSERETNQRVYAQCGADPMLFIMALRQCTCPEVLLFVDVTISQYWATEMFTAFGPRSFFNPSNNQAMGWSIPAAIGAQRVHPGRQVVTLTGDGCMLMTAVEMSTAARECLPVKFFVLDDQAYHYMQALQEPAYLRTTATMLARIDYQALAEALGLAYLEITCTQGMEARIRGALLHPGPVLVRVVTDYRRRPVRWIHAARQRYVSELTTQQRTRFLARIGSRALDFHPNND
jgi:acetolactate synthase-1/2/3 large subunit